MVSCLVKVIFLIILFAFHVIFEFFFFLNIGEETETLDHRKREFLALLKKAKENTGNGYKADKPPRELIDDWTQHGYEKFNYHLAMENHDNLERQNEGLDTVERDEVIKYHKMREAIEGLEEELGKSK